MHDSEAGRIVAFCDCGLLGKTFREGKLTLDLARYGSFYAGREAGAAEVLEELKSFCSLNIVGEKAIELAIEAGAIAEGEVLRIARVPYAQAYKI